MQSNSAQAGFGVLGFWGFGVLGFWGFGVLGFRVFFSGRGSVGLGFGRKGGGGGGGREFGLEDVEGCWRGQNRGLRISRAACAWALEF